MPELLTVDEVSKLLHMHPVHVRIKARDGIIRASKPGNKWLFRMVDIERYLDETDNSLAGHSK